MNREAIKYYVVCFALLAFALFLALSPEFSYYEAKQSRNLVFMGVEKYIFAFGVSLLSAGAFVMARLKQAVRDVINPKPYAGVLFISGAITLIAVHIMEVL